MTKYSFNKTPVSIDRLTREVQHSPIIIALDHMDFTSPNLDIYFRDTLSETDETILNELVAAHSGLPLPDNTPFPVTTTNPKTPDGRDYIATNRIGPGFTLYPTGAGDNIANGTYGNGPDVLLTMAAPTQVFQMLNNWYVVGGHTVWEGANLDDYFNGWIVAPATTGITANGGGTGNHDKYAIPGTGGTAHMMIPNLNNTGAYDLNLAGTLTNCPTILSATPVPSAGGGGWYDFNSDTNVLTVNPSHNGNFNLYDFPINLFKLATRIRGTATNGGQIHLEATDVVGKLIFNSWQLKVTFTTTKESARLFIWLMTAAKKNI